MDMESKYFLKMGGYGTSILKLDGYLHNEDMSLSEFIEWFINEGYMEYTTVYENGILQCEADRYRTLGDIFRICKYYYPNCTFVEVRRLLIRKTNVGHFCPNIKRRVYVGHKFGWKPIDSGLRDELGFPISYYVNGIKQYHDLSNHPACDTRSESILIAKNDLDYYAGGVRTEVYDG